MIVTKDIVRKDGVRLVTVQLAAKEKLMAFKEDSFYELGEQLDMIVAGHHIIESQRVYWCSITQSWMAL